METPTRSRSTRRRSAPFAANNCRTATGLRRRIRRRKYEANEPTASSSPSPAIHSIVSSMLGSRLYAPVSFRLRSLNAQARPQAALQTRHFPLVGRVVVTEQMQSAVKDKPINLPAGAMPLGARILTRGLRRNDDIAKVIPQFARNFSPPLVPLRAVSPREGQDVRRPVLAPKFAIEAANAAVVHETHGKLLPP